MHKTSTINTSNALFQEPPLNNIYTGSVIVQSHFLLPLFSAVHLHILMAVDLDNLTQMCLFRWTEWIIVYGLNNSPPVTDLQPDLFLFVCLCIYIITHCFDKCMQSISDSVKLLFKQIKTL